MKGFDLHLELLEDCVLSETGATVGGHHGLDYIPGSNLLGAVAGRIYRDLSAEDTFTAFHSGRIRFGNALPLTRAKRAAWPMPLCWHAKKRGKWRETINDREKMLIPGEVWHLGHADRLPDRAQPKQIRKGYVTLDGRMPVPNMRYEMKTAIDPDSGRAQESALFGYEALPAGTQLSASITADDDVDDALLKTLEKAFADGIRVGRSRSAQFGRVHTKVVERTNIEHGAPDGNTLVVWLLSDLAPISKTGAPTLMPTAADLALGNGTLNLKQSFLRTRRYSPWNGHRRSHDMERFVISQGSVLQFDLNESTDDLHEGLGFLGAFQESGLGAVWINPPLLKTPQPSFQNAPSESTATASGPPRPGAALIDFLEWRAAEDVRSVDVERQVEPIVAEYSSLRENARQLRGLDANAFTGPSTSQWGNVIAAARNKRVDLNQALFDKDKGLCRPSMEGWKDEFWQVTDKTESPMSFSRWLQSLCKTNPDHDFVALLAREIMSLIRKEDAA